jgi:hypothetical protein
MSVREELLAMIQRKAHLVDADPEAATKMP